MSLAVRKGGKSEERGTVADVDYNLAICLIKYNHIYKEILSSPRFFFQDMEDLRDG